MKAIETVGILGLGKMGGPIAGHVLARGFKVIGYDPVARLRERAAAQGARGAASARVLEGARPGLVVALGSTVAPRYTKRLASRLAEKGLVLLDIPLARGEAAASSGKLLIYGAGDADAFELCRPVFGAFASDIFHLGPAGAGQVAKMVNNLILWACITVNDEGLRLGRALGVDPERLSEALRHGSAQNWAMDTQAERSGMPWAEKDMSIVLEEADRARLSLPLAGTVKETIKGLKIRMGLGMPEIPEHL